MTNPRTKTRLSAFITAELGEWLRRFAFETRQSQGAIVRAALQMLKDNPKEYKKYRSI